MPTPDAPVAGQAIAFVADEPVRQAIARLERTEDICFSPDGGRIVVAGYYTARLLILDVETDWSGDVPSIVLSGSLEVECPALAEPHGMSWADEGTLIVGNRDGQLAVLALPEKIPAHGTVRLEPIRIIGADGEDMINAPGSLQAIPLGMGFVELLVCNNYVNTVSRHLLDRRDGHAVLASEILLAEGVNIPDGVAQGRSGQWIAVSNHDRGDVLLFRNDAKLDRSTPAQGILAGIAYPHGVRFSADERTLIVADSGTPYVQLFRSADGDWSGRREPWRRIRVLADELFAKGHISANEGGPKGVDISPDNRLLVVTCKAQQLAFFDMREHVGPAPPETASAAPDEADRARAAMVRYMAAARATGLHQTEASRRQAELMSQRLDAFLASRAWRITAPIRWVVDRAWGLRWALKQRRRRFP